MAISKREKKLLVITITALSLWVAYNFGAQDLLDKFTDVMTNLEVEQTTYESNISKVKEGEELLIAYRQIEAPFLALAKKKKPEAAFDAEVSDLCKAVGFEAPNIRPAKREVIEGVYDYEFLTLVVEKLTGKYDAISKLLKGFYQRSLIIRNLDLRNKMDSDEVILTIDLARIVRSKEAEREDRKELRRTRQNTRRLTF